MAIVKDYRPCYHVIFMDIEMPGLDGMQAAHVIRQKDSYVVIVFITNIARYAVQGYEVGALDFILKPIKYEAFAVRMNRIVKKADRPAGKSIVVSSRKGMFRIALSQLLYVEVNRHQVSYHTIEQEICVSGSLKEAESMLLKNHFEKCNSCYLVNLRHVKGIKDDYALVGEEKLQISRSRKKGFMQAVADYVGSL